MTRRGNLAVLMMAICLPSCSVLGWPGWGSEPKAPPPKIEVKAPAPEPTNPPDTRTVAPPQVAERGAQESEEATTSPRAEPVPAPPAPTGSKEGPPASSTGPKAAPAGAPTAPGPQEGKPQYVSLNFDNAELELVLRSIADITGINFVIGPGVKANVTMRMTTKVPASEVFSIMELVLEVNNLVAVKDGSFYKIVPIAVAQQEPEDVQIGKERAEARERYITQIVHLDHLSADEMAKILQSFLARGAKLVVHKETNSMIIAGFSSTVKRLLDTVRALDLPTKRDNIQRIFVYFVENVQATQLASILNTLYGRRDIVPRPTTPGARPGQPPTRLGVGAQPPTPPPPPVPVQPPPAPGQPPPAALPPGVEPAPGEVLGDVTIVPDEATNALVIKTSPRNYEFIEATIKKLDIVPKQVLIELLLAQIRLSDQFNFSLEEVLRTGSFAIAGIFGGPGPAAVQSFLSPNTVVPPAGFTLTFVDRDKFRVVLANLAAVTKVEVLANPHLLTANNKEAKIQIGQEVPIVTGDQSSLTNISATPGTTGGVFRTLQQKDIGIIVGIKPHVNEKRLVTLEIENENIAVDQANFGAVNNQGGVGSPSFLKTTTKTSVVVQDGQSLVIGGIIRTDKSKGHTGIPFLSQIPLLGYLFRSTSEVLERNELVILITPYVVASPEEGRAITEQFKRRVQSLEPVLKTLPRLPGAQGVN